MRLTDQIKQCAGQAQASGGPNFLGPGSSLGPGPDARWRPTPDPVDGGLRFDPEFSLPSVAGPVTWRLFYDSTSPSEGALTAPEYGWGRRGSFPMVLVRDPVANVVTITHEDGSIRTYNPSGSGGYVAAPLNGDAVVQNGDGSWDETLGDSGLRYHFPSGDFARLNYRTTPQGQYLTYTYATDPVSGLYQSISVQEPAGRRVTLTCNAGGFVQTVEDWGGRGVVVLTYGPNNDLTELWEQEGVVTRYGYDVGGNHLVTSILDPAGFETTYTYGGPVYVDQVASRSVAGNLSQYSYPSDNLSEYVQYTDPLGRTWTHLNNGGYPSARIDLLGNVETYTYTNSLPTAFQNALGYVKTFAYDSNGYLLSQQDELGNLTTFMHDSYGNILSVINALGNITTYTYTPDAY